MHPPPRLVVHRQGVDEDIVALRKTSMSVYANFPYCESECFFGQISRSSSRRT